MKKKPKKDFFSISLALVAVILVFNLLFYFLTIYQINKKIDDLDSRFFAELTSTRDSLAEAIKIEREISDEQRNILRNETLTNFERLQNFFNAETSQLKLNLETQLGGISKKVGGLEEKSSELENRVLGLDIVNADFTSVIEDVLKTVVSIKTNRGQASGVIFDERGFILTNKHVVVDTTRIKVIDFNQKTHSVEVVAMAQNADLAVLKIQTPGKYPYLDFANPATIKPGIRVISVGNPVGLLFSVSEGIISATNRYTDSTGIGYLQTDVSINPGNSGGPLVNVQKKIVGINTFKLKNTEGVGFSIPADVAKSFVDIALD